MDKLDFIKTTKYKFLDFTIFQKVEQYTEVSNENADSYEIIVRPDYFNREFDINKKPQDDK